MEQRLIFCFNTRLILEQLLHFYFLLFTSPTSHLYTNLLVILAGPYDASMQELDIEFRHIIEAEIGCLK